MTSLAASRLPALSLSSPEGAFIQTLDPRLRLLCAVAFAVFVVSLPNLSALFAALGLAFVLVLLARLPVAAMLRRMLVVEGLMMVVLLLLPFTTPAMGPDDLMLQVWGLPASWSGLWHALRIVVTSNAVVFAMLALVGSLPAHHLVQALTALGLPDRLVQLLALSLRYIDILTDEYQRLRHAMKLRGFQLGYSWHCYRSLGYLVAMLIVRSLERSERVLAAMTCRGYTGRFPVDRAFRLCVRDWGFVASLALACGLLGAWAWGTAWPSDGPGFVALASTAR